MPKKVDPELQRRAIAGAAIAVIDAAGIDGARLRDVARAAAVTTGAITHYFDGKDAVLLAAMDEIVRRILDKQAGGAAPGVGLPDMAAAYLPTTPESQREWRVWIAFWGRAIADETLRARHRAYYAEITARLAADLATVAPQLSAATALEIADVIVAAIDGVGTRATLEPEQWPPARQRAALARLLDAVPMNAADKERTHANA
ncbi:MAG: TetR family transcriptional regulator C-terminal domain-containing protein [Hyphomonadaceae bacterium]|nr:TetR family transcriptional regulator C-terminal domain-containing protein [Hyphomonadaceae bacterium]